MAPAWPVTEMPPPWCSQTDMLLFLRLWVRGTPALPSLQTDLPVCWVNFTLPCAILILFITGGCVTSLFSVCSSLLPDVNPGHVFFLEPRPSDPQEPQRGHTHLPSGAALLKWNLCISDVFENKGKLSHALFHPHPSHI